jgi:putative phage tail component, N-terminal domain
MTIKDSLYFTYNNIRSKDCKILNVSLDGGMQSEYFAANQTINKVTVKNRDKPYFQSKKKDVLTLTVDFAFEEEWTEEELRKVRQWLTEPEYYAPLIFSNNPEKIYYALYIDKPELYHNCMSQGYLTITFECNDAYAYSPLLLSEIYDWSNVENESVEINDFSQGRFIRTEINNEGKLELINNPTFTWEDLFGNFSTWEELFNSD